MVSHVTEVAEGVHRLTNGVANFYLIQESGKLTLVDAGAPKDWALFTRAARTLGKAGGDLDAVLLTHAHTDHTGFAEQARTTTGARVWIHERDVQAARTGKVGPRDGKQSAYLLRGAFWRTALVLGMRGGTKIIPIREVSGFSDGEVLDVPGSPRVVHAPGHTGGSAAILLEDRGVLFTGDVLCTHNAYTGRVGPQIMPSGLNADTPQALASLANLTGIKADVLLPGHGESWTGGVEEAIRQARAAGPS
ncbi:MAG TPA: MBL fold metallo-hydrolase [Streptosporangiaceae bacterium]|nr:MBL fold metallo-hydrolase [Streptosporangiaceae bacterium]